MGEHKHGKGNGQGTYYYLADNEWKGDKYVGEYKDNKMHGQGTYYWASGSKDVGTFENNKLNGYAITYYADGSIKQEGIFKDDKFQYAQKRPSNNTQYFLLKNEFKNLPLLERKWIQSVLKAQRLYFGSIDGIWGPNTQKAILAYADSKMLSVSNASMLLELIQTSQKKTCNNDPSLCSEISLCILGSKYGNKGKRSWQDNSYAFEAKRRGLSCGVSTQTAFANITDNSICWSATYHSGGQTKWRERLVELEYAKYVAEAKRRGLSCGVKETQITKVVPTKTCNDDPSLCTTAQLCSKASGYSGGKKSWNTSYSVRKYVDEAKRFGLTCGVKAPTVIQKTCDNDPNLCNVAQLCKKASVSSGGKKVWRSAYSSRRYVTLAKDLGVSCGVKEIVKVEKPKIDKTYKVASGTGFYVSGTGHVITNDHVIDGCKNIKIQSKGSIVNTRLLGTDTKVDLALLKADFKPAQYFAISNTPTEELDDIIVAGYPFGDSVSSTIKFTKGVVSSLAGIGDDYSQIQIDAALQPGNSGGPIIDEITGNIVAVAVAKLDYEKIIEDFGAVPENTNFGIKASAVRNIMRGNNVLSKTPNTNQIRISELRSLAKEATVHLTCWMTRAQIEKILEKEKGKVLFKEFTD